MKQLKWKSIQGIDYVLSIADGQTAVTQLTPSAQPFVTQTDTSDDIFQPVRPQTGNIGILGEVADMEALLATTPVQRPVTLTAMNGDTDLGTVWQGYLQTSAWSQAWDKGPNEISLPVVDHLGIIGSFTPQLIGWVRFGQFLLHMSSVAGAAHYTHWVFSKLTEPLTTLRYRFSMDNYRHYNTDTETWETDDYLTILAGNLQLIKLLQDRLCFRMENKFDQGAVSPFADHVFRYFTSQRRLDRPDQDRFSGAGFSGEYIQVVGKVHLCFLNECKILHMQIDQHF